MITLPNAPYFHVTADTYPQSLKARGYPFSWYIQREPRKLLVGPKGFGNADFYEAGPVTCAAGYSVAIRNGSDEPRRFYALKSEGQRIAETFKQKIDLADICNEIPEKALPC